MNLRVHTASPEISPFMLVTAQQIPALSQLAVRAADRLQRPDINTYIAQAQSSGGGCAVDADFVVECPAP